MTWALPKADTYFAPILAEDPRGFQIDHLELALKHCKRFRTAVDGGAHVGTWSVALAARFDRVIAFEPAPDTFECLSDNVANHGVRKKVEVYRAGLGEKRCRVPITDDDRRRGNTGARHISATSHGELAEIWPLDMCDIPDIDFLKLDLEGYELFALRGAIGRIKAFQPVILIEVKNFGGRFGCHHEDASKFLLANGYREVDRVRNDRIFVT